MRVITYQPVFDTILSLLKSRVGKPRFDKDLELISSLGQRSLNAGKPISELEG